MQYNTQRPLMPMPQYGRCIHEMVLYVCEIEDRAERQLAAEALARLMAAMQAEAEEAAPAEPVRKNMANRRQPAENVETAEAMQRVWDHLAYISGYRLDVDYPYPITRLGQEAVRPNRLAYPKHVIRHRQYGLLLERSLELLPTLPKGEERDEMLRLIANQMKQSLCNWNRDAMDDQKVADDIAYYTQDEVQLDLENFRFDPVSIRPLQGESRKKKKK